MEQETPTLPLEEQKTEETAAVVQAEVVEAPESEAVTVREDFGAVETRQMPETASTVLAAQAKAQVEARYIVAMKRPRDIDVFRENLLKDCKRPLFAEQAEYAKPIGNKKVTGASIRFVETALRHFRNVLPEVAAVYDDERKKIVRTAVTDLETNVTYSMDVTIEKVVERGQPRQGENGPEYISARRNSNGKLTYLVPATEDDLLNKERALVSKAIRTLGTRILPGDIVEEALRAARTTLRDRAAKDPDAERKAIADAFASLNVPVAELKAFLGHELSATTPAELVELRALYSALKEGELNWTDAKAAKGGETATATTTTDTSKSKTESIKDRLAKK